MVTELTKLYNTLLLIETKGENTKNMANCLRFIEQLIANEQNKQSQNKMMEGVENHD